MYLYNFTLKGYVSFGEYPVAVKLAEKHEKVTDQDLQRTLDEWLLSQNKHVKNVYKIVNGNLVLDENHITARLEESPFAQSEMSAEIIASTDVLTRVFERINEKERNEEDERKKKEREEFKGTRDEVIAFFAEEESRDTMFGTFVSFCKTFWWFFLIILIVNLFYWGKFDMRKTGLSQVSIDEVKEFVLKQDFSQYRPSFSYVLNGEPIEIVTVSNNLSCRDGNNNLHRIYKYDVRNATEKTKFLFTFRVDQNSAGKVSTRISCATKG